MSVERTTATASSSGVGGQTAESWIHLEVDRQADPEHAVGVREELLDVLEDVRLAVDDWPAMDSRCGPSPTSWTTDPAVVAPEERAAAQELLRWMADDHFTFLGYREYELTTEDGVDVLRGVPGQRPRCAATTAGARPTRVRWPTCPTRCRRPPPRRPGC